MKDNFFDRAPEHAKKPRFVSGARLESEELQFPDRNSSVANGLYYALQTLFATIPHEKLKEEVMHLKMDLVEESRKQILQADPNAEFRYNIKDPTLIYV